MTVSVGDVLAVLEAAYPPATAESWDAVGLVCGDRREAVSRVLFCVDPDESTVDEALEVGAQLLVAHHPLLLRGVTGVPADHPKGALVHRLIRGGVALFTAHTNADAADPGVSDALAAALGLVVTGPLSPAPARELDVLATYVPVERAQRVLAALHAAGAGAIGDYRDAAWLVDGVGQFRPVGGANPAVGEVGSLERLPETRLEVVLDRRRRADVVAALRAAHPYEEVAFNLNEIADVPSRTGIGRVGELAEAEPLRVFAQRVADALPATAWGVRAAGDPERPVRRVAVCGGAGDGYLSAAVQAGVDAYVTSDLRHHPAGEHLARGGPALVDVAHWAGEWPWCGQAAGIVRDALGGTVDVLVSTRRTDPWTVGVTTEDGGR
ncbi:Nif3-like dinuclear metal center hexameric protein [Saccharothrix algeriensis]|uniref:GTP cyclohydrolase 1 type 2 homolog n=1 Tax=Saccharothrix algeriensis TaxID=173560 RepID=A0A8T8I461_9PSEU|nr:Nif3-like dinuclear metal center hexameric protein [Saccharothrix algeriensis]MBM7811321.1 dinuclear metal center YbgI/SA1388 family protein [Saccharothrix algeriensis]QTR05210.1 Nif3-like dinuclear metal center hexameric protein [Saccharothrix algeriensis]